MKKVTAAQDGSSITERMEIDHNKAALAGVDGSGLESAIERLMDYRKSSGTVMADFGGYDEEDPFADPPPQTGTSGGLSDDAHDPMDDLHKDDLDEAIASIPETTLEDTTAGSGGLDNFDPDYVPEDAEEDPSAPQDLAPPADEAADGSDRFSDLDAESIDSVSTLDTLLDDAPRDDRGAQDAGHDLLGEGLVAPVQGKPAARSDAFDSFLDADSDAFEVDGDGFGSNLDAPPVDKSYRTPEPELPGMEDDAFKSLYDDDNGDNDLMAQLDAPEDDRFEPEIDPVAVEAPARAVRETERRRAPEATELPDGWEIGTDDPDSATAAVFAVPDTDETRDEKPVKKDKKGKKAKGGLSMFGKMFGGRTKKTKVVRETVETVEFEPDANAAVFDDGAEEVVTVKPKAKKKGKILLLSGTALALLLGGAAFFLLDGPNAPAVMTTPAPIPAPVNDAATRPGDTGTLGLPGDPAGVPTPPADAVPALPPSDDLGLPGDAAPAPVGDLGLPGDAAIAPAPAGDIGLPGDVPAQGPVSDTPIDLGGVTVAPDTGSSDGMDALMEDAGVESTTSNAQLRAELDNVALKLESLETILPAMQQDLTILREALQIRDAAIESQDGRIDEALAQSTDARQIAEDQNQVLIEFAHTKEDVARGFEVTSDLSRRVVNVEATQSRVDDLFREVAQMRRDLGAVVRTSLESRPRTIVAPTAPSVAPAPASAPVYDSGSTPLSLPAQIQVPADVEVGDEVPGGGKVLDIVPMENAGRLVIMEEAQVRID